MSDLGARFVEACEQLAAAAVSIAQSSERRAAAAEAATISAEAAAASLMVIARGQREQLDVAGELVDALRELAGQLAGEQH